MSELLKKEQQAIRLLKALSNDQPIEISYSGGKDSDVILTLAQMAGIDHRALYKNTTIDPPGTIKHAKERGAEVIQPALPFLKIIEKKGFPTMRARFCCEILKEYKILDYAVQGIRRSESTRRAARYKEPVICRFYRKGEKTNITLPILEWTDEDVALFITSNGVPCHPLYYDEAGNFQVKRRLGCMGCPLKADRGKAEFRKYPKLLRAWLKAGQVWWDRPREKPLASAQKFGDIYGLLYNNLFCRSYNDFLVAQSASLFGKIDFKQELETYFNTDLTI